MRAIFLSVAILISSYHLAFSAEQPVKLKLDEVKIYLKGAELTHSASLKLKQGNNEILLENIANAIKPNTINVSLNGNATIMDINEKMDYLTEIEAGNEIKALSDSVSNINYKIRELNNEVAALNSQADILANNKIISGKDKVMTAADLKQVSDFYYEASLKINNSKLKLEKEIGLLQQRIQKIQSQIAEVSGKKNQAIHQLVLNLHSKTAQSIDIAVKYFINEAGWNPFYDIRVDDINSPVSFQHKANVWQTSGMDFNDVKLTISTRNPSIYGDMPIIATNYLRFMDNYQSGVAALSNAIMSKGEGGSIRGVRAGGIQETLAEGASNSSEDFNNFAPAPYEGSFKDAQQSFLTSVSAEFAADIKYTIPTDGKTHFVDLVTTDMPAQYEYYAAPKYRPESFLIARMTDWEELNLLPGSANVFFSNSYIGQTALRPEITLDTMSLSLGVDKNIIVTREKIKDFTETKFLSSDIERNFAYKINIKNTKKSKIKINVEDQIPVSTHEDIKVKALELSSGKYDKESGKILWIEELEPGKSIEKIVKYSVRYPAGKTISE